MNPNRFSKEGGVLVPASLLVGPPIPVSFSPTPFQPLGVHLPVPRLLVSLGAAHLVLIHLQQCVPTLRRSAEVRNQTQMRSKVSSSKKRSGASEHESSHVPPQGGRGGRPAAISGIGPRIGRSLRFFVHSKEQSIERKKVALPLACPSPRRTGEGILRFALLRELLYFPRKGGNKPRAWREKLVSSP